MAVESTRHFELFSLAKFMQDEDKIDIIGAGATGSKIAIELAKLGILGSQIRVWDFDRVEPHNLANQAYGITDVGKLKVEALSDIIYALTGEEIETRSVPVEPSITEPLHKYVFVLTDTMSSRKQIWDSMIKRSNTVKHVIETRMGIETVMVFTVDVSDEEKVTRYEESFYGDGASETSACGTSISVGPTSSLLSSLAVWQFMKVAKAGIRLEDAQIDLRTILSTNPYFYTP